MLLSYNWLKELVPDLTLNPKELADLLTAHSFETVIASEFTLDEHIKVVRVEKIEPHPNADRLRIATINTGKETIKVVCGAPNIAEGQLVPFSPPGTQVLDKDGQLFELTIAKIRGVESPGMLNSRRELGLGTDHDGIFVLPEGTELGSKLSDHIPSDTILEADITPNRAHDALSHLGVAREIAAHTNLKVVEPKSAELPQPQPEVSGYKLDDINAETTPRYMNIIVEGITNTASPLWLQARLMMLGQKPINALVDITNYVMFEIGNPTHAFAAAKLPGKTISVREAKADESLQLLDGTSPQLPEKSLLITADDKPVALAGIMGGQGSEVALDTTETILEIANFHPYTIQKTALGINKRTEAAARFLKGIDPNKVQEAARRLAHLVTEITQGKILGVLDFYPSPHVPQPITFTPTKVSKIAGTEISTAKAKEALEALRFEVKETGDTWQVTPPSDRLDITAEHDVIEEIIFWFGLDNIPSTTIKENPIPLTTTVFIREKVRDFLVQNNLTETYNYSFENAKTAAIINIPPEHHLTLQNPIAPEFTNLRTSLLPGLLANIIKNKPELQRQNTITERGFFEIGHVFYPLTENETGEGQALAALSLTPTTATLKKLLQYLNVPGITIEDPADNPFIKNNQVIKFEDKPIGWMGQIQPAVAQQAKYRLPLYAFEVNLEMLLPHIPHTDQAAETLEEIKADKQEPVQYAELNRYPSVFRDLSVLVDPETNTQQVQEVIERVGGELLSEAELFDEYSLEADSEAEADTQKSLSFHLEYQAKDRTLTDKEITELHESIVKALKEELGAEVR